jgi:aminoglycoside phosphotransferase family enzyme/predicted kinase
MMASDDTAQAEVIAFLRRPASHGGDVARVDVIETHGALVFLAGDTALKIKRAVRLAYLDFSTLARREAVCRREIEINRPNAPAIYRDVVAITREADGRLAIGGDGEPVEWAVRMARFDQGALLSDIAERTGIDDALAAALAQMMLAAHHAAERRSLPDAAAHVQAIIDGVDRSFAAAEGGIAQLPALHGRFLDGAGRQLRRVAALLQARAAAGLVRRCHGDAHLGNIVLSNGAPQLFDAIEFDESLATIDVLYDLAFLLMDLDRRGEGRAAHIVLDRYLADTGQATDLQGLTALPLFLGLRAAIRAMVAFDRARVATQRQAETIRHGLDTLARAIAYLAPPPPRLIAVGGFSGTGKTTLARALAPLLRPVPGALHLRSDVVRKQRAGVAELQQLPASAYTAPASDAVYGALLERARVTLAAGHSVVVDAVFSQAEWRSAFERLAADLGVAFDGLWLEAGGDVMKQRVAARSRDASDATPDVVDRQLAVDPGPIAWHRIAASADRAGTLAQALAATGLAPAP